MVYVAVFVLFDGGVGVDEGGQRFVCVAVIVSVGVGSVVKVDVAAGVTVGLGVTPGMTISV